MALEGSLSDFGLADILQLIYFQRKTGVLKLESRMDKVKLAFVEGNITGAESKRRMDDSRLGKILLKKGFIKDEDLKAALEEQKKTHAKLGNIVIQKGLVQQAVIGEILGGQITETVIQLFGWKQGTYEFSAQSVSADKDFPFSLDTQHLLMEGLRIVDEWSVIKEKISLDTIFARTSAEVGQLNEEEAEIYGYVDGDSDVSTIIDLCGQDSFQVSRTLVSLLERGLIRAEEAVPVVSDAPAGASREQSLVMTYLPYLAIALSLVLSLAVTATGRADIFKNFRAAGTLEDLRLRIETYRLDHASYPQALDDIAAEKDPWGRPFVYRLVNSAFFLSSAGPDGVEGTADDIY